jgi:hypothetical protein
MGLRAVLAAICLAGPAAVALAEAPADGAVDLELVLAVDVSGSIDEDEAQLQRAGYVKALADPRIAEAIEEGFLGRIALTYVEWGGPTSQHQVIGWHAIDSSQSARNFAGLLAALPIEGAQYTSISSVIDYGIRLLQNNAYSGTRSVIDISGDGPNNSGRPAPAARDAAVAAGITINGLPILNGRPNRFGFPQLEDLDQYYVDCVIGGPGAFVTVAEGFDTFADTVLRKLLLEIAMPAPEPRVIPAQGRQPSDCLIGERQLQRFLGDMDGGM